MTLAPRTLPSVAIPKPKISLQFLFRRGMWGGSRQKMERKIFGFGSDASFLQKGLVCIFYHCGNILSVLFLRHSRRCEALPYPRLVIVLTSAHTSQPPRIGRSHSLTMPARCLLRVHSVASFESVVALKSRLCMAQANVYVLAPARPMRAQADSLISIT